MQVPFSSIKSPVGFSSAKLGLLSHVALILTASSHPPFFHDSGLFFPFFELPPVPTPSPSSYALCPLLPVIMHNVFDLQLRVDQDSPLPHLSPFFLTSRAFPPFSDFNQNHSFPYLGRRQVFFYPLATRPSVSSSGLLSFFPRVPLLRSFLSSLLSTCSSLSPPMNCSTPPHFGGVPSPFILRPVDFWLTR